MPQHSFIPFSILEPVHRGLKQSTNSIPNSLYPSHQNTLRTITESLSQRSYNMSSTTLKWSFHDPSGTSSYTVNPSSTEDSSTYTISINSGPKTDWWTTAPAAHRTSGPVVYQSHTLPRNSSFKLSGVVTQKGAERFQQTTLYIRRVNPRKDIDEIDGQTWLKSGIENEGGKKYVG